MITCTKTYFSESVLARMFISCLYPYKTEISDDEEICDTRAHIPGYVCRAAARNFD